MTWYENKFKWKTIRFFVVNKEWLTIKGNNARTIDIYNANPLIVLKISYQTCETAGNEKINIKSCKFNFTRLLSGC